MKPDKVLYLLASEEEFRLYRGQGAALTEVVHRKAGSFSDGDYEFGFPKGQNRSGGISFDVSGGRSEAEIERPRFARHAVSALSDEWGKGSYDKIVVSAGPKLLGALRKELPQALVPHIAAELHKDLVKLSPNELPGHFKDVAGI